MSDFTCPRCKKQFNTKFSLDRHQVTLPNCIGYYFTCKRCLYSFDTLELLDEHQLSKKGCDQYKFKNKIELRNRVVTEYNIKTLGFKPFIQNILTPVQYDKSSEDTKLNLKLTSLVYDSLSVQEFVEVIKYAAYECPNLKLNLLTSLQTYIQETKSEEKVEMIKQFYLENRTLNFD